MQFAGSECMCIQKNNAGVAYIFVCTITQIVSIDLVETCLQWTIL